MKKNLLSSFVLGVLLASSVLPVAGKDTDPNNFRPSRNVTFTETTLPLVFINVNGQTIERENRVLATMKIINNKDGHNYLDTIAHAGQTVDWEGPVAIKYRGNTSFTGSDKKPFSIRPLSAADLTAKKAKVSIMGMAKDNDWAMLAPWEDMSYMRDVLTMELARGGSSFAPHMKYCEVVLDGYYYGIYIMSERATKGKNRLNLDDPTADDLTGDFHVEIDRKDEEHYYVSKHHPVSSTGVEYTNRTVAYQYKEPEYDDFADLPSGVEEAIGNAIEEMESSFTTADYTGENGYRKYIDVQSFIDYQIAQEFSNNVDAYRLSTPLYKYSTTHAAELGTDAKWKTALWDFNIAYGTANYYDANNVSSWRYKSNDLMASADQQLVPFFWYKLMNDPAYVQELRKRWTERREGNYSEAYITAKIDSMATVLQESGALDRDNEAWNNHFGTFSSKVSTLKSFVTSRLAFMDKAWKMKTPVSSDLMALTVSSGFNADVIAEATPSASHVTGTIDQAGYALYTTAVQESGALAGDDHTVVSADGVTYVLADYTTNNALTMTSTSDYELEVSDRIQGKTLYCLAISADGKSVLTVTPKYTDGTTGTSTSATVSDWYGQTEDADDAVNSLGRILTTNSYYGQADAIDAKEVCCLYEIAVPLDKEKTLSSVTFSKTGGRPTVFAMTAIVEKSTAIKGITDDSAHKVVGVYSLDGKPRTTCVRGINIIRYDNGAVKKVVVK